MIGVGVINRNARSCLRLLRGATQTAASLVPPTKVPLENPQWTPFLCNICGASNCLPKSQLVSANGYCAACRCHGLQLAMMYAVASRFSPNEMTLARIGRRKEIRGLGICDGDYALLLAKKFRYVNTYCDKAPRLDPSNVDWLRWNAGTFDFITCGDVLGLMKLPVDRAFENMHRLLKPGGVAFLPVPRPSDSSDRQPGSLRHWLVDGVTRAGFRLADINDDAIAAYGVSPGADNPVLIAEKTGAKPNSIRVSPSADPYRVLSDCQEEIAGRTGEHEPNTGGYAARYRQDELGYWANIPRWIRDDFSKAAARRKKLRCLDVGCAYGTLLLYAIKSLGCEPYAVDFIQFLPKSLIDDYGINYRISNIEREAFPWPLRFDVILFTEVLEHLNFNAVPTLKKLRKLLAPGGRLYLSTPDALHWGKQTKYYADYSELPMPSPDSQQPLIDDHVWQFNERELRRLTAAAGFRIARFDYSSGSVRRHFNLALKPSLGLWRFGT